MSNKKEIVIIDARISKLMFEYQTSLADLFEAYVKETNIVTKSVRENQVRKRIAKMEPYFYELLEAS